jgi:hypothetical protein
MLLLLLLSLLFRPGCDGYPCRRGTHCIQFDKRSRWESAHRARPTLGHAAIAATLRLVPMVLADREGCNGRAHIHAHNG